MGEASRAIEFQKQGLALTRELGDRHGEEQALDNLGNACAALGDTNSAVEYHEQALVIAHVRLVTAAVKEQRLVTWEIEYADLVKQLSLSIHTINN